MSSVTLDVLVGLVGLGNMSEPIAKNLLSAGARFRIYNRTESKTVQFKDSLDNELAAKVEIVTSPKDAIPSPGGIVISMVANDDALDAIVAGEDGILAGLSEGGIHLCMSTVSPTIVRKLHALHKAKGAYFVSCPVFGRPPVAAAKRLIAVLGGEQAALDRVTPLIQATSQKIVVAGDSPDKSNTLKLCGNFMILATIQAQAEAFALAESHGIDRNAAYELISGPQGMFASIPLLPVYGKMIAQRNYEPVGFTATNGLKDARLINDTASEVDLEMPIAQLVLDRLTRTVASDDGKGGSKDWATFAELVEVPRGASGAAGK
mmetsp:Transcript_77359/g.208787  ORF Transcript_77359/g.208787 Transcript_77359/m.208787 type:complete len:320 (-) Transcript_77359:11-970(-)